MKLWMGIFLGALAFSAGVLFAEDSLYVPFGKLGYLTSSFGESRGTRYHAGVDYSTEMQEGFPSIAPEDGKIVQVKMSPYGYGKVIYFEDKLGRTWVFAHQSGFSKKLDSLIRYTQKKTKKNDISIDHPKIPAFQKGDTLSYTGSSGIGNPHLHLELRSGESILNPCHHGTLCGDTLDPQILGAAVFQGEDVSITGEEALKNGCLEVPDIHNREDSLRFTFKIADYSREPLENPMSVRRVTLKKGNTILGEIIKDTLKFSNMLQIREELLWAEEADTAGDWHYFPNPYKLTKDDTLEFETEDMTYRVSKRRLILAESCEGKKPMMRGKNQKPEMFTFLSRTWIGLDLCQSDSLKTDFLFFSKGKPIADSESKPLNPCKEFAAAPIPLGKILAIFPDLDEIRLEQNGKTDTIRVTEIPADAQDFTWETEFQGKKISQNVTKLSDVPWTRALGIRKFQNDSVPAYEFHPKGLHFWGSWTVSFDANLASAPLYYLGETSRRWFYFSKQKKTKQTRFTSMNEIRDIGFIQDNTAPELGEARLDSAVIAGKLSPVVRIPVIEKESGIENGNAIQAFAKGVPYIYAEYDSEPQELVFVLNDLPQAGKSFKVRIQDEVGNVKTFEITVPTTPTEE
jgi:hypothetical protein